MTENGKWADRALENLASLADGEPKHVRLVASDPRALAGMSAGEIYEAGRRDERSSLTFDIAYQFSGEPNTPETMDDLLGFFRRLTGDPNLAWPESPVDWRDMFARYARSVQEQEGYFLMHEFEWTPGEWGAITALPGMERPV